MAPVHGWYGKSARPEKNRRSWGEMWCRDDPGRTVWTDPLSDLFLYRMALATTGPVKISSNPTYRLLLRLNNPIASGGSKGGCFTVSS